MEDLTGRNRSNKMRKSNNCLGTENDYVTINHNNGIDPCFDCLK